MKILLATDEITLIEAVRNCFSDDISADTAGNPMSFREHFLNHNYDITFCDLKFLNSRNDSHQSSFQELRQSRPGVRFIILSEQDNVRKAIDLIKMGADDYLTYPVDPLELRAIAEKTISHERKIAELQALRTEFWDSESLQLVKTESQKMKNVYEMVQDVAPTNSTVLLTGETGVGKGVLARLIHQHSSRKNDQFIQVHCGAIPDNLIESELFGHEKGAFTGAIKRKLGKFELANGGTIFLDEVSTLTPAAQIKLLQVMQDSIFQRVGGESDIKINVRIIAATNENLKELSQKERFRSDLFYRLNVFPIEIPPLRDRTDDIEHIVHVFISRLSKQHSKQVTTVNPETLAALKKYSWPGNIRELENLVERAYILEKSSQLSTQSFPLELFKDLEDQAVLPLHLGLTLAEARNRNNESFERQYLIELLTQTKGKIGPTAEKAGISVRQLNNLMNKYKIYKEEFKTKS
jgi:DNA-binding NtrC family response regulator